MNPESLRSVRCPRCRGKLDLVGEGDTQELRCRGCAAAYPATRGIPRFAGEPYVASFGRQWNRYEVARDEEDEAVFRVKTGIDPRDLGGRLVLDAGCGGGRYARLAGVHRGRGVGGDLHAGGGKAAAPWAGLPRGP